MNIIDSLILELGFDTTKIARGQKEASGALKKTSDEMEKHGNIIEARAQKFGEAIGVANTKLLVLFATMILGGRSAKDFATYITETETALGRSAKNIGISTDALAGWQYLVKQIGGTAEDATAGLQTLANKSADLKLGHPDPGFLEGLGQIAAKGGKALDPFHVDPDDLNEDLNRIAEKFGAAEAQRLGQKIGLNEKLINVLMRRREVNQKERAEAEKFAPSTEAIKRATDLQTAWVKAKMAIDALGETIMDVLDPALTKATEYAGNFATHLNNGIVISIGYLDDLIKKMTPGVIDAFQKWKDAFSEDFKYVGGHWREMLDDMWGAFGDFGKKIGDSGSWLLQMFEQAFKSAFDSLKKKFNEIWSAFYGHPLFGDAGAAGSGALPSLGEGAGTDLGGGRFHVPGTVPADPGHGRRGLAGRGGASPGSPGWWTPERQQHAYEKLRAAGLSDMGAKGLVSRWAFVESNRGPASVNPNSGAFGIAQWLGPRKVGIAGNTDFDAQLGHVIKELKSSEGAAFGRLSTAATEEEGAVGATMYERAENYNKGRWAGTHKDDWTGKTQAGIGKIHTGGARPAATGATPGQAVTPGQTDPHKPGFDPKSVKYHDYSKGASLAAGRFANNTNVHSPTMNASITVNTNSNDPHKIASAVKEALDKTTRGMHSNYGLA